MILDVLMTLLDSVLGPVIRLLPTGTIEHLLPDMGDWRVTLGEWDNYIPLVGPLRILSGYVLALSAFVAFRVALFVWRLIPGKAS